MKDGGIGFDEMNFAGEQNAMEPVKKIEAPFSTGKSFCGPVAERVDGNSGCAEQGEDVDGFGDGAGNHFGMALEPGVDERRAGGMLTFQGVGGLGETSACILLRVPGGGADVGEKMLHGPVVSGEELAV